MSLGFSSSKSKSTATSTNSATTSAKNISRGGGAKLTVKGGGAEVLAGLGLPPWLLLLAGALILVVVLALIFRS